MYFPVDLDQLDSKGIYVPTEPDEIADEYLIGLARLHTPAWPTDSDGCEVLEGVELVFHAGFCFRHQNSSRYYDVVFQFGEDGTIGRVKERKLIRGG